MPVDACLGFRKVFNVWLEHVSLRSLRRASQLQRTKHDTSADPRRAFCCCHQFFKKPQDNICLSPPFYRFFYFLEEKTKNCSCFISEHAWNKYDTFKGITNTNKAQLMTNIFACVSAWLLKKALQTWTFLVLIIFPTRWTRVEQECVTSQEVLSKLSFCFRWDSSSVKACRILMAINSSRRPSNIWSDACHNSNTKSKRRSRSYPYLIFVTNPMNIFV